MRTPSRPIRAGTSVPSCARSTSWCARPTSTAAWRAAALPVKTISKLQEVDLPSGLCIRHASSAAEVMFLYNEVYSQQQYLQHGITLKPGDTVIDVGANIGLFSMLAAEAVGPSGRVLSIEASPVTAAALAINLQQHAAWCAQHLQQVAVCDALQLAVTNTDSQPYVPLTVYPRAAGWSTLVRDDREVITNMHAYLTHLLQPGGDAPPQAGLATAALGTPTDTTSTSPHGWTTPQRLLVVLARQLARVPALKGAADTLADLYVTQVLMRGAHTVSVPAATLSQVLTEHSVTRVDLLKVDVERGELRVLQGLGAQHWQSIQQITMEVHDINGQLGAVQRLLEEHGFTHVVLQQPHHLQGSDLHNLYARRG